MRLPTDAEALEAFRTLCAYFAGTRAEAEHRSKLVRIKEAKVSYRSILDAEKAGELQVYRRGKDAFVNEDELDAWIMASHPTMKVVASSPVVDEVAAIIAGNGTRGRTRAA